MIYCKKGFSLFEIMVATAILSLGLVMIYEAFLVIADVSSMAPYYVKTQLLIDKLIWESEDELRGQEYLTIGEEEGDIILGNKKIHWRKETQFIAGLRDLYKVNVNCTWKSGSRTLRNSRTAYVRR